MTTERAEEMNDGIVRLYKPWLPRLRSVRPFNRQLLCIATASTILVYTCGIFDRHETPQSIQVFSRVR